MINDVYILAIETSCDDTSVAILKNQKVLSNIVSSQKIHEIYGGVVPELASREHDRLIIPVLKKAINDAGVNLVDIHAIAYTRGPGLLGSLLVGTSFAKSLALSLDIPLIEINHMQAHILSIFIDDNPEKPEFPFIALTVSGGHTQLVLVKDYKNFVELGTTLDDAAGEAFDKLSRFCGFGFPGGPAIQKIGEGGDPNKIELPRPKTKHEYNYSFSGLKTAATNFLNNLDPNDKVTKADFAASYQEAIVDSLLSNFVKAVNETGVKNISGGGGVMANSRLREKMNIFAENNDLNIYLPTPKLSTDNAAMVCVAAQNNLITNDINADDVRLSSIIA